MIYRTRTYIAADWDSDVDAVNKLYEWNDNEKLNLSFTNAHDLTQARDSSLNCSIKNSLRERLNGSKTFVLIVGSKTNSLTKGSCQHCYFYSSKDSLCLKGYSVDYRSFITYECENALKAKNDGNMKIVVLYNNFLTETKNCPISLKYAGTHEAMRCFKTGKYDWDYQTVKKALE